MSGKLGLLFAPGAPARTSKTSVRTAGRGVVESMDPVPKSQFRAGSDHLHRMLGTETGMRERSSE